MSSILTNTSAMAAIQTLRTIGSTLERTQNEVSSGLRIGQASDNAAYWSIATTMRSDSKAISAVEDALGLGAAKVSVAYAGMESTVEILSEFKARLVAGSEAGVDKAKIQEELEQFKEQLISISQSSSFSGENWLNTDISDIYDTALNRSSVVSSFVRASNGSVQVQRTEVDLSSISLLNSTGGGILQVDDRSPRTIGGLALTNESNVGLRASTTFTFDGPLQFDDASTFISFDLTLDADDPASGGSSPGQTVTITVDRADVDSRYPASNGLVTTATQFGFIIHDKLIAAGLNAATYPTATQIQIATHENTGLLGSSIQIQNVQSTLADPVKRTGGLSDMAVPNFGTRGAIISNWDGPFRLHEDVELFVPIQINGATVSIDEVVGIDRAFLDGVLGKTTGMVDTAAELAAVLQAAFDARGFGVNPVSYGTYIQYDLDPNVWPENGSKTRLAMQPTTHNLGTITDFNIVDVDITTPGANIPYYLTGIEKMLQRATHGASILGSIDRRIDLQTEFAKTLQDSIGKGIGRLVDADMNEASTRLKALQTQQQLGIQSLSIANSNAEHILTLFH